MENNILTEDSNSKMMKLP